MKPHANVMSAQNFFLEVDLFLSTLVIAFQQNLSARTVDSVCQTCLPSPAVDFFQHNNHST